MNKYYYTLSSGSYSDYFVTGLAVADHKISQEEWETFCNEQFEADDNLLKQMGTERCYNGKILRYEVNHPAWDEIPEWVLFQQGKKAIAKSYEQRFVELHKMEWLDIEEDFNH